MRPAGASQLTITSDATDAATAFERYIWRLTVTYTVIVCKYFCDCVVDSEALCGICFDFVSNYPTTNRFATVIPQ